MLDLWIHTDFNSQQLLYYIYHSSSQTSLSFCNFILLAIQHLSLTCVSLRFYIGIHLNIMSLFLSFTQERRFWNELRVVEFYFLEWIVSLTSLEGVKHKRSTDDAILSVVHLALCNMASKDLYVIMLLIDFIQHNHTPDPS